jgi:hypothetical protein
MGSFKCVVYMGHFSVEKFENGFVPQPQNGGNTKANKEAKEKLEGEKGAGVQKKQKRNEQ